MKVAMVFGKGLDGCGVQRGGVEMAMWAKKVGVQFDVYWLDERAFMRSGVHGKHDFKRMKVHELESFATHIDQTYDVVILNSYPSAKHTVQAVQDFYWKFVKKINRPVLVGMMHEVAKQQIDRIPQLFMILNRCDVVYNFSEKTWFSQNISRALPSKVVGLRARRFRLWIDLENLAQRQRATVKHKRLLYMGRWSTLKDPRRVLELDPMLKALDPEFKTMIIGIEKSIGAKYDIMDHPRANYPRTGVSQGLRTRADLRPEIPDKVQVYGPYNYDVGMELMAESMFGTSFYRMPKDPQNYGDRMEYTQIEIIGLGTIPVFDVHYGQNNVDETGRRYIDVPYLAVWSDRDDLQATAQALVDLANDPEEQRRYLDSSYAFVEENFDAAKILPEMFKTIKVLGKDHGKWESERLLMAHIYGSEDAADFALRNFGDKMIPLGFKELETQAVHRFIGEMHKREEVFRYQPPQTDLSSFF